MRGAGFRTARGSSSYGQLCARGRCHPHPCRVNCCAAPSPRTPLHPRRPKHAPDGDGGARPDVKTPARPASRFKHGPWQGRPQARVRWSRVINWWWLTEPSDRFGLRSPIARQLAPTYLRRSPTERESRTGGTVLSRRLGLGTSCTTSTRRYERSLAVRQVAGPPEPVKLSWVARGTYARRDGATVEVRDAIRVPLRYFAFSCVASSTVHAEANAAAVDVAVYGGAIEARRLYCRRPIAPQGARPRNAPHPAAGADTARWWRCLHGRGASGPRGHRTRS